jgi:Fe-S cluster assembly iron-binding protein IscA
MIGVSEGAKKELKRIMAENAEENKVPRLTASQEGQLGLMMDVEKPGDQAIEHEGSKVLLVEDQLASHLGSISLDAEETPEGTMLMLRQTGCGSCCGGGSCGDGETDSEAAPSCGGGCCGGSEKHS